MSSNKDQQKQAEEARVTAEIFTTIVMLESQSNLVQTQKAEPAIRDAALEHIAEVSLNLYVLLAEVDDLLSDELDSPLGEGGIDPLASNGIPSMEHLFSPSALSGQQHGGAAPPNGELFLIFLALQPKEKPDYDALAAEIAVKVGMLRGLANILQYEQPDAARRAVTLKEITTQAKLLETLAEQTDEDIGDATNRYSEGSARAESSHRFYNRAGESSSVWPHDLSYLAHLISDHTAKSAQGKARPEVNVRWFDSRENVFGTLPLSRRSVHSEDFRLLKETQRGLTNIKLLLMQNPEWSVPDAVEAILSSLYSINGLTENTAARSDSA